MSALKKKEFIEQDVTIVGDLEVTGGINNQRYSEIITDLEKGRVNIQHISGDVEQTLLELDEMSSDSKLTPVEKLSLKREWDAIETEYSIIVSQGEDSGITTGDTARDEYDNAYNSLYNYLFPDLLGDLTVTSDVVGSTLRSHFETYYNKRRNFLHAIDIKKALSADVIEFVAGEGILVSDRTLFSNNYVSGSDGWKIMGSGNAEFSDIVARGTIYATGGQIAGFTISGDTLTATNFTLDAANEKIYLGANNEIRIEASMSPDNVPRMGVFDSLGIEKVSIGYFDSTLTDPDTGNPFTTDDYGIYVAGGNRVVFQVQMDLEGSDIVQHDGSVTIKEAVASGGLTLLKMGTESAVVGYHLFDNTGTLKSSIYHSGIDDCLRINHSNELQLQIGGTAAITIYNNQTVELQNSLTVDASITSNTSIRAKQNPRSPSLLYPPNQP
jgi:hypothetical protein